MIEDKVNDLDKKIKALDDVTGFKKSVTEFNKVNKELEDCILELNSLESMVEKISIESEAEGSSIVVTDEQYICYMNEIKSLIEIFDELHIREQIELYKNAVLKIKLCDYFLKSQKTEIIYLDKKK